MEVVIVYGALCRYYYPRTRFLASEDDELTSSLKPSSPACGANNFTRCRTHTQRQAVSVAAD